MIVDTGVLYPAADTDDTDHKQSARLLTYRSGPLLVPTPVIVETSWLLESRLGPAAELAFLRAVEAGELTRVDLLDHRDFRVVRPRHCAALNLVP